MARNARFDSRLAAFRVLRKVDEQGASVRGAVDRECREGRPSGPDRALLRELAAGVTRRRLSLDAIVDAFSSVKPRKIDPAVRRALRIGLYQMVYLDRIPVRAAVDTTVDLVARARRHAKGFANAVLRAVSRSLVARDERPGPRPRRALPVDKDVFAVFDRDVLPDPREDEIGHLAAAYSHPAWLVERWQAAVGSDRTLARLRAGNRRPQTFLRLRPGREETLRARFAEAGVPFAAVPDHPDCIRLEGDRRIAELPGYGEGDFVVQDLTAQSVAPMLAPAAEERILDVCAAPGGKTAHLADLTGDRALVVAADVSAGRLRLVTETVDRLKLRSVRTVVMDATRPGPLPAGSFDRVLIDAPCSNTGVLRRRVEARWRLRPEDIPDLVARQSEILAACAPLVRPGGTLLYGTCSLEEEENRQVVAAFLRRGPGFRMGDERPFELGAGDGGYAACIRKSGKR